MSGDDLTNPGITHVIFDMDGLLLDTERLYTEATQQLCDRFGKVYTFDMKRQVMGKTGASAAQAVIDLVGIPMTPEEYIKEINQITPGLFRGSQCLPGAEKLVRHLHSNNVPMAVCTGSNQTNLALKTTLHKDMFSLFNHVVTSSDDPEVKFGKPHPQPFQVTQSRFPDSNTIDSSKILVFEDSPIGIQSAKAAGMRTVMVPDPRLEPEFRTEADLVLSSLEHFKPEDWGLPSYSD